MDDGALLRASRHERALYEELHAAYRALASTLCDDGAVLDVSVVAAHRERADAATAALRQVATVLAPRRLGGVSIPHEVRTEWQASAALAAEAAEANARLMALARARQVALSTRLVQLGETRRVLAGYRPPGAPRGVSLERA
jgi:hypothetical protein